ncbi:MAG: hypothetical protein ACYC7D_15260 [Nitrososphaerales archaeon]
MILAIAANSQYYFEELRLLWGPLGNWPLVSFGPGIASAGLLLWFLPSSIALALLGWRNAWKRVALALVIIIPTFAFSIPLLMVVGSTAGCGGC